VGGFFRREKCCPHVAYWHLAEVTVTLMKVRYWEKEDIKIP
jgi:hypothetical protein